MHLLCRSCCSPHSHRSLRFWCQTDTSLSSAQVDRNSTERYHPRKWPGIWGCGGSMANKEKQRSRLQGKPFRNCAQGMLQPAMETCCGITVYLLDSAAGFRLVQDLRENSRYWAASWCYQAPLLSNCRKVTVSLKNTCTLRF